MINPLSRDLPPPINIGTYGLIFKATESRLEPNVEKVCVKIINEQIRENVRRPNDKFDAESQALAQLFSTGTDSDVVVQNLIKQEMREKDKIQMHKASFIKSSGAVRVLKPKIPLTESKHMRTDRKELSPLKVEIMNATVALHHHDKSSGQKYYVPRIAEPYEAAFQALPASNNFSLTSPKMWPTECQYTKSCARTTDYDSTLCSRTGMETFGKPQHSKSLKKCLSETAFPSALHPLPSASPCSKTATRHHHDTTDDPFKYQTQNIQNQASFNPLHSMNYCAGTFGAAAASSSGRALADVSALQATLVQCGKLDKIQLQTHQQVSSAVMESLAQQKKTLTSHARWLKHNISGAVPDAEADSIKTNFISTVSHKLLQLPKDVDSFSHGGKSEATMSSRVSSSRLSSDTKHSHSFTASHSRSDSYKDDASAVPLRQRGDSLEIKCRDFNAHRDKTNADSLGTSTLFDDWPSEEASIMTRPSEFLSSQSSQGGAANQGLSVQSLCGHDDKPFQAKHIRYSHALADHLKMLNPYVSHNPFRTSERSNMRSVNKNKPLMLNCPTDYKENMRFKKLGQYGVILKASNENCGAPSRDEINCSLAALSKTNVLSYDTRIVETGALVKALQDVRCPCPGLPAIISLHRSMIDAACMNPNPWLLNRLQLSAVISSTVPWLEKESVSRLLSSYDPQHSGLIRFVRLSVSLLCCARPAMNDLKSLLNKAQEVKKKRASKNYCVEEEISTGHDSEIFLLRLIHGLYEECEGGMDIDHGGAKADALGVGMRLQDFMESVTCCICSIEDQIRIDQAMAPVLQLLFERGQSHDIINYKSPLDSPFLLVTQPDLSRSTTGEDANIATIKNSSVKHKRKDENSIQSESLFTGGNSLAWKSTKAGTDASSDAGSVTTFKQRMISKYSKSADAWLAMSENKNGDGAASAATILKHKALKSVKHIPRISQDLYIESIGKFPHSLDEFSRQLQRFRGLVAPYSTLGSVCYETSVMEQSSYGTRDCSNKSLFQRSVENTS